jgi:hypothetical protein
LQIALPPHSLQYCHHSLCIVKAPYSARIFARACIPWPAW